MSVNNAETKFFEQLVQKVASGGTTSATVPTLAEMRSMKDLFAEFSGPPADVKTIDATVPVGDNYQLPIRVYNPEKKGPTLIFFSGCGYVLDLFEANAIAASRIAGYANAKVIIVNYRLCPEVTVQTSINDAYDATKYIATHPDNFNVDPKKIMVGGFSSGAHAAASIATMSRNDDDLSILHSILLNGCYDFTNSQQGYEAFEAEDKICNRDGVIEGIYCHYGFSHEQLAKPQFSLVFEKEVSHMPATTLLISEYDGLRSDSEAYYQRLSAQNSNIERMELPGQTHNTLIMRGAMSDGEDPAKAMANIIKRYQ